MYGRVFAQTGKVLSLKYNLKERKAVADGTEYTGIDGLYFEGDVVISDGVADFSVGEIDLSFSFPVNLSVETETYEGITYTILAIKQPQGSAQAIVAPMWRPGDLIRRLLEMLRGREGRPTASKVRLLSYYPASRKAEAYDAEKKTFENVDVLLFTSLGNGSKMYSNVVHLYPPSGWTFTVVQDGKTLRIENVSE